METNAIAVTLHVDSLSLGGVIKPQLPGGGDYGMQLCNVNTKRLPQGEYTVSLQRQSGKVSTCLGALK